MSNGNIRNSKFKIGHCRVQNFHSNSGATEVMHVTRDVQGTPSTLRNWRDDVCGVCCNHPLPWLAGLIINLETTDPAIIVLASMAEAKRFDTEHEGDADYRYTAIEHVEDFVL